MPGRRPASSVRLPSWIDDVATLLASSLEGQIGGAESDFVIVEWTGAGDPRVDWIAPLHAAKGVPHTFGNARPGQQARYLLVLTPRIQALISALHARGADDPARIFAPHDSELLG